MVGKQPKRKARPGVDVYGRTPLHYAAMDGNVASVLHLLTDGADPNGADDNGWTPLHFAAQEWQLDVARLLLEHGAEVDVIDAHGNTPLFEAVFSSRGRGELILMLRHYAADPLRPNHHGVSPLSLARTIANYNVAQYFDDLPHG